MTDTPDRAFKTALRQVLQERFSETNLRDMCYDLGIDYDALPGENKADRARELIVFCEQRQMLPELLRLGRESRSDIQWSEIGETSTQPASPAPASPIPSGGRQINTGGGTYIEGNVHVSGGDFVARDRIDHSITVGNISNATGIVLGHDQQVTIAQPQPSVDEIAQAFVRLQEALSKLPAGPDKAIAQNAVTALEQEAHKGDNADESAVGRWFAFLAQTAPDAWQVAMDTFIHPIRGLSTAFKKIAAKAQEDTAS